MAMTHTESQPLHCLICFSSGDVLTSTLSNCKPDGDSDSGFSVSHFILRKLLEIPKDVLANIIQRTEDSDMIAQLCQPCSELVITAVTIYKQLLLLTKQFREVQKDVLKVLRQSCRSSGDQSQINDELGEICRTFVVCKGIARDGTMDLEDEPIVVEKILPHNGNLASIKEEIGEDESWDDGYTAAVPQNTETNPCSPLSNCSISIGHDQENFAKDSENQNTPTAELPKGQRGRPRKLKETTKIVTKRKHEKKLGKASLLKPITVTILKSKTKYIKYKEKRGRSRQPPTASNKNPQTKANNEPFLIPKYQNCEANPTTGKFHCLEQGCEKQYKRRITLQEHVRFQHYGEKRYKCKEPGCGSSFVNSDAFLTHQHKHKGTPKFKCKDCPATFYTRNPFIRHQERVHLKGDINKPFICELCGKGFSCRDHLYGHRQATHLAKTKVNSSNEQAGVICDLCGISLKNKMVLQSHVKMVHEKKPGSFVCSQCPRSFHARPTLQQHLFSEHDIGQGFKQSKRVCCQCPVVGCRARYSNPESLEKHRLDNHGKDGEKPPVFACKFCNKRFHVRGKLNVHETIHKNSVTKPFVCHLCSKGFLTITHLHGHWKYTHKLSAEELKVRKREIKRQGLRLDSTAN